MVDGQMIGAIGVGGGAGGGDENCAMEGSEGGVRRSRYAAGISS